MAGDVAKLLASLDLQDQMSPKLKTAVGNVSAAEKAVGSLGGGFSKFAANLKGGVSNALTTFEGRLKQAGTAFAGFLGIGGVLGIGAVIGTSIKKLEDFSLALEKVQTLTGETARDSGTLILLFQKFGIGLDQVGTLAGFAEKTLGKLNQATVAGAKATKSAALAELERQRLVRISEGLSTKKIDALIKEQKATDALNASLANAADGTTKLQALDKQYGLSLIDAKGKTVSFSEELRQVADFYDRNHDAAQRAFVASQLFGRGYAALAPILDQGSAAIREAANEADALGLGSKDTADQIIAFRNQMRNLGTQVDVLQLQIGMALVPALSHFATDVSNFVRSHGSDITKFFRDAGQFAEDAAGTIGNLVGVIGGFWNSIPSGLRDILTTGIVGDRTIKFLFGFSPIGTITSGISSLLANGLRGLLSTSPIGRVLSGATVPHVWVDNLGPGGLGGIPGAVGGLSGLAVGAGGVFGLSAILTVAAPLVALAVVAAMQQYAPGTGGFAEHHLSTNNRWQFVSPNNVPTYTGFPDEKGQAGRDALVALQDSSRSMRTTAIELGRVTSGFSKISAYLDRFTSRSITDILKGIRERSAAKYGGTGLGTAAVNATFERDLLHHASVIAKSTESEPQKLLNLQKIMDDLRQHGDRRAQAKIAALISTVKNQKPPQVSVYQTIRINGTTYRVSTTTGGDRTGFSVRGSQGML